MSHRSEQVRRRGEQFREYRLCYQVVKPDRDDASAEYEVVQRIHQRQKRHQAENHRDDAKHEHKPQHSEQSAQQAVRDTERLVGFTRFFREVDELAQNYAQDYEKNQRDKANRNDAPVAVGRGEQPSEPVAKPGGIQQLCNRIRQQKRDDDRRRNPHQRYDTFDKAPQISEHRK